MTQVPTKLFRAWIPVLFACTALVVWMHARRLERVDYVSGLAQAAQGVRGPSVGGRDLIVPERAEPTYHWLAQTDQMLGQRECRVRRVDYDNAPYGREVWATSPYRWWLGTVAMIGRWTTGRPLAAAAEWSTRHADLALQLLALWGATLAAAACAGPFAAAMCAVGLIALYPLGAAFVPGVADHHGLAVVLALAALLSALAAFRPTVRSSRWMAAAGVLGAMLLWVDVPMGVPVLIGAVAGGIFAAVAGRSTEPGVNGWRIWGLGGAATTLAAYWMEYAPGHLAGWHLETVHPVYGIAWIGAAELVVLVSEGVRRPQSWARLSVLARLAGAVALLASVPIVLHWNGGRGWLATDVLSVRLANVPGAQAAESLAALWRRDGSGGQIWAVLLPLTALLPAGWVLSDRITPVPVRAAVAFALGPVLVLFGFACRELALFRVFDAALVVLIVAAAVPPSRIWRRTVWAVGALAVAAAGFWQVVPPPPQGERTVLTRMEAEELIERDLARWLGRHAAESRPIVYAPPHVSTTLCYYGNLRGIGSFDPDNRAGFGAALSIAGARTMEEVQAAIQARGIRYVVVPSWDPFFDEFASRYLLKAFANRSSFFIAELRAWHLPLWLRPVAYTMPGIPGFEHDFVRIFEVVDEQRPAMAASRLVEYLLEQGLNEDAMTAAVALRRFPGDCGALAAQAMVSQAQADESGFRHTVEQLRARLELNADRYLAWDRRVSVATVLAQANDLELARAQMRRCVAEITEPRLKGLSTGAVYRLLVLSDALQTPIADVRLRELAVGLLPAELRAKL